MTPIEATIKLFARYLATIPSRNDIHVVLDQVHRAGEISYDNLLAMNKDIGSAKLLEMVRLAALEGVLSTPQHPRQRREHDSFLGGQR
jgi:hypothetical protein